MTETVNVHRLAEIEVWAETERAECLADDMPISAEYYADVLRIVEAIRQSDTRIEGGDFPSHRFDGAKDVPSRTSDSSAELGEPQKAFADTFSAATAIKAQFSNATYTPTPEHVEGDVLSVEEMATDDIFDWLKTELSAIDIRYRGDPSYDHDAYWFRDRVENLFDDARKAFPEISSAQVLRLTEENVALTQNAESLLEIIDMRKARIKALDAELAIHVEAIRRLLTDGLTLEASMFAKGVLARRPVEGNAL